MLAVVPTTCLRQCNKALDGEPFSLTISNGSVSLLPVVDVNGVLLVAAAPFTGLLIVQQHPHFSPLNTVSPFHGGTFTATLGPQGYHWQYFN